MIAELRIGTSSRARIWFDELPQAAAIDGSRIRSGILPARDKTRSIRQCAIELTLRQEPLYPYALLGGQFEGTDDGSFRIEVCAKTPTALADWSRISTSVAQEISVGLPRYEAEQICALLERLANEESNLPSGRLVICHGLYSLHSSPVVYSILARSLFALLCKESGRVTDSVMASTIENAVGASYRETQPSA